MQSSSRFFLFFFSPPPPPPPQRKRTHTHTHTHTFVCQKYIRLIGMKGWRPVTVSYIIVLRYKYVSFQSKAKKTKFNQQYIITHYIYLVHNHFLCILNTSKTYYHLSSHTTHFYERFLQAFSGGSNNQFGEGGGGNCMRPKAINVL